MHHHCLLVGFGADAINPYLAFEALEVARSDGLLDADVDLVDCYRKGVAKGMLKVMAKMGISTLHSYKGAQIFEALGLADDVINRAFVGTVSRLQGVSLDVLAQEVTRRHAIGFPEHEKDRLDSLPNPGEFHWRSAGERHIWTPQSIFTLQVAARRNDNSAYEQFAELANANAKSTCTLRGLLEFNTDAARSIDIDEVEPADEIVETILHRCNEFRFDIC